MNPPSQIALIVIYNHRYDKNISSIENLYNNRFSNIYHLVPFYDGIKDNVIPVYENSLYFEGYVAQGFRSFYNQKYMHYLFVADDMILNPTINEQNYTTHLKLDSSSSFIPRLEYCSHLASYWAHARKVLVYNPYKKKAVEITNELPTRERTMQIFAAHGLASKAYTYQQLYGKNRLKGFLEFLFDRFIKGVKARDTNYPLARSYSDIFAISSSSIKKFCAYSGLFAATDLFVEAAIPTAMLLSCENIITEKDLNLRGQTMWSQKDFQLVDKYAFSLSKLINEFPEDTLYLHPIKLSQWK